uniref:NADH-ubiquinone oxidoreductase chain 3 n=1 Tax=Trichonephila clavata TaxID=2740835 RepID=A0A060BID8_TRICU|nr:NADH dehydrogenase subunit 3 [Trichonephila clavata]UQJ77483.1 NADH dehydrogenase subunit 3 [Trichonephila clavata]
MFLSILLMSCILVILVMILFILISYKKMMDFESSSSYECGFIINSSARLMFSYRFFLISVLFLIFDVEIVLMLMIPFLKMMNSMFVFFVFIFVLVGGLIYEYYYGSLEWL